VSEAVQLVVVSPEAVIFAGKVRWVQIPLADGMLGVWPGHAPLVGSLGQGEVSYETDEGSGSVAVEGGTVRIDAERCVLMVGSAGDEGLSEDHDGLFGQAVAGLSEEFADGELEELGL